MRVALSVGLLVVLGFTVAAFAWIYRNRLFIIFGIKPKDSDQKGDVEAQEVQIGMAVTRGPLATEIGLADPGQFGAKQAGNRPYRKGSVGSGKSSSSLGNETSDIAPMIVVATDGANRGAHLPYDALEAACGNWADGRRIGSGGAATVYRGELPRYGTVAVKRFHPKENAGREWTRELEALIQCRHPHILEIIGHADEGPENLIVMPLMEGGTLGESLHKIWWATRVVNMGQVVRALSFLHGKGILHRDVKSSNILLDRSLRHTRLADFGLAKDQAAQARGLKTSHGTTGVVVGSPGYMAPELMMRPANEKTDAFATGVVFLEMLTGLPAWDTDENGAVLTDRAVADGKLVESLIDPVGSWPRTEIDACSRQAIALTLFDPSQRKTLAAIEQDEVYKQHLERATQADAQRYGGPTLGSIRSDSGATS